MQQNTEVYSIYEKPYDFHDECLLDVLCEPENYKHSTVDMALVIECIKNHDLKKEMERDKRRQIRLKEAQERLCDHEDT